MVGLVNSYFGNLKDSVIKTVCSGRDFYRGGGERFGKDRVTKRRSLGCDPSSSPSPEQGPTEILLVYLERDCKESGTVVGRCALLSMEYGDTARRSFFPDWPKVVALRIRSSTMTLQDKRKRHLSKEQDSRYRGSRSEWSWDKNV